MATPGVDEAPRIAGPFMAAVGYRAYTVGLSLTGCFRQNGATRYPACLESTTADTPSGSPLFNFLFSFLSIYVIGAMLVDLLLPLPSDISQLMQYMDYIDCVFFFVDFCQRFITAERKLTYMRWGWIDLLA